MKEIYNNIKWSNQKKKKEKEKKVERIDWNNYLNNFPTIDKSV